MNGIDAVGRGGLAAPRRIIWTDHALIALDGHRVWLITPVECDPLRHNGRHLLSRRCLKQLRMLRAEGHRFDRIAVLHELDRRGPAGVLLPALKDGPLLCTDAVAHQLRSPPPNLAAARMLGALGWAVGAGRFSADRRPDGAVSVAAPAVFGVVGAEPGASPTHGRPALWFPLTTWRWS